MGDQNMPAGRFRPEEKVSFARAGVLSRNKIEAEGACGMSGSIVVVLVLLAVIAVIAIAATVVAVLRDGRGEVRIEPSEEPWTAGNLPSEPYAQIRFK
jgi:flagellar basal body-associated protein FliL